MHCVVYSEKDKWFFTHIPKNGGTGFIDSFKAEKFDGVQRRVRLGIDLQKIKFGEIHNPGRDLQAKYYKLRGLTPICLVRNPWARALSLYTFSLGNCVHEVNYEKRFAIINHSRLLREGFKGSWMPGGFFRDDQNMQNGIDHNEGRTWREDDNQCKWVDEKTKVFKIETELRQMYEFINVPFRASRINASAHYDYKHYYDDELKAEIAKLYKEDIERFGYTFEH